MNVTEKELTSLKKEIDRVTDYYDTVRLYQFPLNGMFVITELKQKRWKRCQLRSEAEEAAGKKLPLHSMPSSVASKKTPARTARTMHKQ